jgi:hypothetical protein
MIISSHLFRVVSVRVLFLFLKTFHNCSNLAFSIPSASVLAHRHRRGKHENTLGSIERESHLDIK